MFQPRPPRIAPAVLETVQRALARRRVLELRYRDKASGATHPRTVHPLAILVRGPVTYLVATLFDYEDVRHLALHRITSATETGAPCREPLDFDLEGHVAQEGRHLQSRGQVQFEAHFETAAALHLRETPLSADQTWTPLGEDKVRVTATVVDDLQFHWWLLAFGSQIEVRHPPELRDAMATETKLAADLYQP